MGADLRRLRERWQTPDGQQLGREALARLSSGRSLDDLGLGQVDDRVDLRGLTAPPPRLERRFGWRSLKVEQLGGTWEVRGVTWRALDLAGASLESFRFFDAQIENCRFDEAICHDWRLWRTTVSNSSFVDADLANSSLGALSDRGGNLFAKVDFSRADLRGVASQAASYVDCDFLDTRLDKLNFESSKFSQCRFSGTLREVIFDGRTLKAGQVQANVMEDVDFSRANFEFVEFRGLDLDEVSLPDDPGLRIVENYPCVLDRAIAELSERDDSSARRIRGYLKGERGSLVVGQRRGLFNRHDFFLLGGDAVASLAEDVINRAEQGCSNDS